MKTKKLVTAAMLIALGVILSLIKVLQLPFGGSITAVSMLPIVVIGYMYNLRWGLFSAFVYSILQMVVGMKTVSAFFIPGDSQMALGAAIMVCFIDYILAYTSLGIAGIFRGHIKNNTASLCLGAFTALVVSYIFHIISGVIFFGSWAEWFFADSTGLSQVSALKGFCTWVMNSFSGQSLSLFYSVVYNGAYMIPEIIMTVIVSAIISPVISRQIKKNTI